MQGEGSRLQRTSGASDIPQGKVNALLGGAFFSQAIWLLWNPFISWDRKPHSRSPAALPSASDSRCSWCDTFPLLGPRLSGCEHKTCALALLRIKKESKQNITRDNEVKNNLTIPRGERGRDSGAKDFQELL